MSETYSVITGASQGLGKSFALELAKNKVNVILISLPNEGLADLCFQIKENYNVSAVYYETDLSVRKNVLQVCAWINRNFKVHTLINNAGTGGTRRFEEAPSAYIEQIIELNVLATTLLTHQLLSNLKCQKQSYILNVSSLAAFTPIGYKTVYPASKAFVHSFSRGLYQELKRTNVFVSVVHPGPMMTNPGIRKRIEGQGFFAKITSLNPDKVARYCIRQLYRKDTVIMVNHFSWLLLKLLPIWIKLPVLTGKVKKELNLLS